MVNTKKPKTNNRKPENRGYVTDYEDKKIVPKRNEVIEFDDNNVFNPDELFSDSNSSDTAVIKELFNNKNPKIKTELSDDEIKIISRLYELSKKYYEPRNIMILKNTLDQFIILRISKDRKSRAEFVQANQDIQKNKQDGLLNRLVGGNGGLQ